MAKQVEPDEVVDLCSDDKSTKNGKQKKKNIYT